MHAARDADADVVVIGAGMAGLAAARRLGELGLSRVVWEARARTGGRAFTDGALGAPFDRGCHWLHSADINPVTPLARELGLELSRAKRLVRVLGDPAHGEAEHGDPAHGARVWHDVATTRARRAYGERALTEVERIGRTRDVAVADVIERDARWWPWLRFWIAAVSGVEAEQASTADFARYRETERHWTVRAGLGTLVQRWAAGICVHTEHVATRVSRSAGGVTVSGPRGSVRARAAIVALPHGVLANGVLANGVLANSVSAHGEPRFDPPLPDWKRDAIAGIHPGAAGKVAFRLDPRARGAAPTSSLLAREHAPRFLVQWRPHGDDIVVAHHAGDFAQELSELDEPARAAAARDFIADLLGSDAARGLGEHRVAEWWSDPLARGAYSLARPGCADMRRELARPVDGALFFAGEATHRSFYSTLHGAYLSGLRAAEQVAQLAGSGC